MSLWCAYRGYVDVRRLILEIQNGRDVLRLIEELRIALEVSSSHFVTIHAKTLEVLQWVRFARMASNIFQISDDPVENGLRKVIETSARERQDLKAPLREQRIVERNRLHLVAPQALRYRYIS